MTTTLLRYWTFELSAKINPNFEFIGNALVMRLPKGYISYRIRRFNRHVVLRRSHHDGTTNPRYAVYIVRNDTNWLAHKIIEDSGKILANSNKQSYNRNTLNKR